MTNPTHDEIIAEKMRAHLVEMVEAKKREQDMCSIVITFLIDQLAYLDNLIEEGGNHD